MKNYKVSQNINAFILTLYFSVVWVSYVYIWVNGNTKKCFLFTLPIIILSYFFCCKGLHWLANVNALNAQYGNRGERSIVFLTASVGSFLLVLPWLIARYPGSFSSDSMWQYEQALSGYYSDWHPYWHTLFFFTLPLKITRQVSSIILFQMIYFSFALGYLALVIYKIAGLKISIVSLLYILLNPYTGHILLYPWKDIGFAIAGLVSVTMAIDYYFFQEDWDNKWWRFILLGVIMANATLFRYNAILFTAPLALALLLQIPKRQWLHMLISFLLFIFFVKIPLFHVLGVEKPQERVVEATGLPMTIIGNVVKENPGALDPEMAEFVYSIASQEQWENYYLCGNFNSIKRKKDVNLAPIEDAGILKVLKITARCFEQAPKESWMAFFSLTDMVYGLENDIEGDIGWGIEENNYGIEYAGNDRLSSLLDSYSTLYTNTICKYLKHIGTALLLMLLALLAKTKFNNWNDWKKIFLWSPTFIYSFGTMLLLSAPDSRFFYITFLVCPITIIFAFFSRKGEQNEEKSINYRGWTSRPHRCL